MTSRDVITFVSHTNKPGGGELALRRYLDATTLPARLVTMESGGVWEGVAADVVPVQGIWGLWQALRGGGLIVANSMRAAFLAALVMPRRGRLVYWVRDGLRDSAMSAFALALTRQVTARRVSHYITNSEWTAQTVREALATHPQAVSVVHSMCGVTQETVSTSARTAPHKPLRLLYLGRISPWKGADVAVRGLERLRQQGVEATLTLAGGVHFGEDHYAEQLHELVRQTPGATWVGHVEDVQELLMSHDVLVHCSITPEPFGQVAVQAMSHGLPVVATDHGGIREVVWRQHNGILYLPGDPDALAEAVIESTHLFPRLSRGALDTSRSFMDGEIVATTDAVLLLLANSTSRDRPL